MRKSSCEISYDCHDANEYRVIVQMDMQSDMIPFVGQNFISEEEAFLFYKSYASRHGFSIRKGRFEMKNGKVKRRDFFCHREGVTPLKCIDPSKVQRNRKSIKCGCKSHLRITLRKSVETSVEEWFVTTFVAKHNHRLISRDGRDFDFLELPSAENLGNTGHGDEHQVITHMDMQSDIPFVGRRFLTQEEAFLFYKSYASKHGFLIRKGRFEMKNGKIKRRDFFCRREGVAPLKCIDPSKVQRNRKSLRCGCRSYLRITLKKSLETSVEEWFVTKFAADHNHELLSPLEVCSLPVNKDIAGDDDHIFTSNEADFSDGNEVRYLDSYELPSTENSGNTGHDSNECQVITTSDHISSAKEADFLAEQILHVSELENYPNLKVCLATENTVQAQSHDMMLEKYRGFFPNEKAILQEQAHTIIVAFAFQKFQEEIERATHYSVSHDYCNVFVLQYYKEINSKKEIVFREGFAATCSCRHFEFSGILCQHIVDMFIHKDYYIISSKDLPPRWRASHNLDKIPESRKLVLATLLETLDCIVVQLEESSISCPLISKENVQIANEQKDEEK